jgi:hypothetical protein
MNDLKGHHVREAMLASGIKRVEVPCADCSALAFFSTDGRRLYYRTPCGCNATHTEVNWHQAVQRINAAPELASRFGLKIEH